MPGVAKSVAITFLPNTKATGTLMNLRGGVAADVVNLRACFTGQNRPGNTNQPVRFEAITAKIKVYSPVTARQGGQKMQTIIIAKMPNDPGAASTEAVPFFKKEIINPGKAPGFFNFTLFVLS